MAMLRARLVLPAGQTNPSTYWQQHLARMCQLPGTVQRSQSEEAPPPTCMPHSWRWRLCKVPAPHTCPAGAERPSHKGGAPAGASDGHLTGLGCLIVLGHLLPVDDVPPGRDVARARRVVPGADPMTVSYQQAGRVQAVHMGGTQAWAAWPGARLR